MRVGRKELANHYRVGIDTVKKWERMKIIPRLKIGNVIRFDLAKVEAALAKYERKVGA